VPIEDLLDAGAFTARLEKLDRVFCNVGRHRPDSHGAPTKNLTKFRIDPKIAVCRRAVRSTRGAASSKPGTWQRTHICHVQSSKPDIWNYWILSSRSAAPALFLAVRLPLPIPPGAVSMLQLIFKNRVTSGSHRELIHRCLSPFGVDDCKACPSTTSSAQLR
jgi:hypothetical protein